jgi:pyruvate kinase
MKKMYNFQKTKIIATIGPASSSKEVLREMIMAGVDVCRLNFSHGSHEDHLKVIKIIHELNQELNTYVALLGDLQGPKIRIGDIGEGKVQLVDGKTIIFTTNKCVGNADKVHITYPQFPKDVKAGERILIDDGKLFLEVISTNRKDEVKAKIIHGGPLSSRKGVNLPNTKISMPCLTEKDLIDLEFAVENKLQWVGLSFVRSSSDIIEIKHVISRYNKKKNPRIIAKIEKPEAIKDIDNIIKETDAIMVARGDLGVEIPNVEVPLIQKMIVKKCLHASTPVIIATQMLESMITNISPTRAEVSDVANSILDGADACMLSGETSVGDFVVDAVDTMNKIIAHVEKSHDIYYKLHTPDKCRIERYISDSICYNACVMAQQADAKAIISMTYSGYSALKIASQRPNALIFIFTNNRSLLSTLSLVWGIRGFYYDKFISTDHTIEDLKHKLKKEGYISEGETVINVASTPIEKKGMTNMIKLSVVE